MWTQRSRPGPTHSNRLPTAPKPDHADPASVPVSIAALNPSSNRLAVATRSAPKTPANVAAKSDDIRNYKPPSMTTSIALQNAINVMHISSVGKNTKVREKKPPAPRGSCVKVASELVTPCSQTTAASATATATTPTDDDEKPPAAAVETSVVPGANPASRLSPRKQRAAAKQAQQLLELNSPSVRCSFEVFGRVQRVQFRRYTAAQADKLQLRGWCKNTRAGSVRGELEGPAVQVTLMQSWLRMRGSPKSRVDRVTFSASKPIKAYQFEDFEIRQT